MGIDKEMAEGELDGRVGKEEAPVLVDEVEFDGTELLELVWGLEIAVDKCLMECCGALEKIGEDCVGILIVGEGDEIHQ
ncbi:hypothetical protein U1Q18_019218, partial [Sarracenia purpurea var. burkii]